VKSKPAFDYLKKELTRIRKQSEDPERDNVFEYWTWLGALFLSSDSLYAAVPKPLLKEALKALDEMRDCGGYEAWVAQWKEPGSIGPARKEVKEALEQALKKPAPLHMWRTDFEKTSALRVLLKFAETRDPNDFGTKTHVTHNSEMGLPTGNNGSDEVSYSALPPDAAHPGAHGRAIGPTNFNTPDMDRDLQPRTLGVPGAQTTEHPVNDTTDGIVTRRPQASGSCTMGHSLGWISPKGVIHRIHVDHGVWALNRFEKDPQFLAWRGPKPKFGKSPRDWLVSTGWVAVTNLYAIQIGGGLKDLSPGARQGLLELINDCAGSAIVDPSKTVFLDQEKGNASDSRRIPLEEFVKEIGGQKAQDEFFDALLSRRAFLRLAVWKQRWKPGKRRRKQRGQARAKSRAYYRKNRAKLLRKQRRRRSKSSWKNNPARKRSEARRKKQNRKMIGSRFSVNIRRVALLASNYAVPTERGGENGRPQRRQRTTDKRKDQIRYRKNKNQNRLKSRRRYHLKCKKNPRCMKRREMYRKNPGRYERRAPKNASVLTIPQITFVLGPEHLLCHVHSVSPLTGVVTFQVHERDVSPIASLPVEVLLRVATFMSDADTLAFMELVETEIGLDAYEDLDHEGLLACAQIQGYDVASEEFSAKCAPFTDGLGLEDLQPANIELIADALIDGAHLAPAPPENVDVEDIDFSSHLFYGQVSHREES